MLEKIFHEVQNIWIVERRRFRSKGILIFILLFSLLSAIYAPFSNPKYLPRKNNFKQRKNVLIIFMISLLFSLFFVAQK